MQAFSKLFFVGIFSVLSTGCLPVVLLGAGAATGTALSRDSRSLQTISDDTDIQFQVNQALRKDQAIYDQADISPLVFNHIVLLVGQAPSEALRAEAEQLTQKIPKVRRVYNQIQIAPNVGAIQVANDATISTNIKARMAITSNLNSNNFTYVVENKVVYLMGLANTEQTRIATDVIRNSTGVKKLVTLVEIMSDHNASHSDANSATMPADTNSTPALAATDAAVTTPATTTIANADVSFQPVAN